MTDGQLKKLLAKKRFDGADLNGLSYGHNCVVDIEDVNKILDEAKKDMDSHKHRLDAHPLFFGGAFVLIPLKKWTKWFGSEETQ